VVEVLFPTGLDDARNLLIRSDAPALLAGGTDLLVQVRQKRKQVRTLISLDRVEGIQAIGQTDQQIFIRSGASLSQVMDHPDIRTQAPVLARAIGVLGSPQIRNMGTLGGNIMTASPAGDTLPPLYVLDASVDLAGPEGFRCLPLSEFITGPGQTALAPGEILWQVRFNKPAPDTWHWFEKVGQRKALSIAMVSLAALFSLDSRKRLSRIRLAWGSVGPTIVQSREIEDFLCDSPLAPEVLKKAGELVRTAVSPISDVRATAAYRRDVAGRLMMRLDQAVQGAH
jgi:xanthine dehydrogenase FAD-binding subunit